jgi:hypothetical protein
MERAFDAIVHGAELKATANHTAAMADVVCPMRHKIGYVR